MLGNLKIGTRIFGSAILIVLTTAVALILYSTITTVRETEREIIAFRTARTAEIRQNLRNYVDVAYETIVAEHQMSHRAELPLRLEIHTLRPIARHHSVSRPNRSKPPSEICD